MKNNLTFYFTVIVLFFLSCNSNENFEELLFENHWVNSFEEGTNIYRPSGFTDFPPTRFRQRFSLETDGDASFLVLAPNDAHYSVDGIWSFDELTNELSIFNIQNELLFKKKVIELSEDKLALE